MFMKVVKVILWFSAIYALFSFLLILIESKKNEGTFKCDCCGRRFEISTKNFYLTKDEIICEKCYGATLAPYKIEPEMN